MKKLRLITLLLVFVLSVNIMSSCTWFGGDKTTTTPSNPEVVGEIIAGDYVPEGEYYVGEEITVSFAGKFDNTTGKALTYKANVGTISNRGQWTYVPETVGKINVVITASVGELSADITFELDIKPKSGVDFLGYTQDKQYRLGDEIQIDLKSVFSEKNGKEIAFSVNIGSVENGVWKYTPDKSGVVSAIVSTTVDGVSDSFGLYVTVTGAFAEKSVAAELGTEDIFVGEYSAKADEQLTLLNRDGSYADMVLTVPASTASPVLAFYYRGITVGSNAPAPMIYVYDGDTLISTLYNGVMAKSGGKGQGMGVDTGINTNTEYQLYAFDLNRYFTLEEEKELTFRFADGISSGKIVGGAIGTGATLEVSMSAASGVEAHYAGINLFSKNSIASYNGPYGKWSTVISSDDYSVGAGSEEGYIKLTARGQENPTDEIVVSAYALIVGGNNLSQYKMFVKGNGEYRIYAYAVDATNASIDGRAIVAACEYMRPGGYYNTSETSKGDKGWVRATEEGQILFYPGTANTGNMMVMVVVAMRASETDTYIEFATPEDGVYAVQDTIDGGNADSFEDVNYDFNKYFFSSFSGVNTNVITYSLEDGAPGTIDPLTGVWQHNFDKCGTYTFDVIASAGEYRDSIAFTINVAGKVVVDEYTPADSYKVNDPISMNFGSFVKNSTDEEVSFEANLGEIDSKTGEWSYIPTSGGKHNVSILVNHSTGNRTINFVLNVEGNIGVTEYVDNQVYGLNDNISIDFSKQFSSANSLRFSLVENSCGEITSNGVWTFSSSKGGIFEFTVKATDTVTEEEALLTARVVVEAAIAIGSGNTTINSEVFTIGGQTVNIGESATIPAKSSAVANIIVPSSDKNPVLRLLYSGHDNIKVRIAVYDGDTLIAYLYKNDAGNGADNGLGVKGSGPDATLTYQPLVFELNEYFEYGQPTELKFEFEVVSANTGGELSIATVAVVPESYLTTVSTEDGHYWNGLFDNSENSITVNGNTVRIDVKGQKNPDTNTVVGAYDTYYITESITAGPSIRFWVKGNAEYRIMLAAIDTHDTVNSNNVTRIFPFAYEFGNPNTYSFDTNKYYNGWTRASENGNLVFYRGTTNLKNTQFTVIVMVRASSEDSYIEICESKYATGTAKIADEVTFKASAGTLTTIDFTNYLAIAGSGKVTFSKNGGDGGELSSAGTYKATFNESGAHRFTVTATDGSQSVSINVTIAIEGDVTAESYTPEVSELMLGTPISVDLSKYVTNTTGYKLNWTADRGTISETGVWSWTPDMGGQFDNVISVSADTPFGVKSAQFKLSYTIKTAIDVTNEFVQNVDIYAGTPVEIDFNQAFRYGGSDSNVKLVYTLVDGEGDPIENASFNGSVLTATFVNGGYNDVYVKASYGEHSAVYCARVYVNGIFENPDNSDKVLINTADVVISGNTYKPGEVVALLGGMGVTASMDINIPSNAEHPYMYFYYRGEGVPVFKMWFEDENGTQVVVYDGSALGSNFKYGAGMGLATHATPTRNVNNNTVWLLHAIDLSTIKNLDMSQDKTWTLKVSDMAGAYDASASRLNTDGVLAFAGVRVIDKKDIDATGNLGDFGNSSTVLIDDAEFSLVSNGNVTLTQLEDGTVRLNIAGIKGNEDATAVLFLSYNPTAATYGKDLSFFVKGNGSYRIQHVAALNDGSAQMARWLEVGVYSAGDGNDYDMEWYKATSIGNWHATNTGRKYSYTDSRVTLMIMVRASEEDTYLDITSGRDMAEGAYVRSDTWDNTVRYDYNCPATTVKAGTAATIKIGRMFYGVKGGEGNGSEKYVAAGIYGASGYAFTYEILDNEDGRYGTVDASGNWKGTFREAGVYEFVIRGTITINGTAYTADLNMKITVQ